MEIMGYITLCIPAKWPDKRPVHCFTIPQFVDDSYFTKPHHPEPPNYPELELAGTILSLVDYAEPLIRDKEFTNSLAEVANKYIDKVREGLPEGVELKRVRVQPRAKAA